MAGRIGSSSPIALACLIVGAAGWGSARSRSIERIANQGRYPSHRNNGWSDALQGIANDDGHWFFTQTRRLWKFPVSHDLNDRVAEARPSQGILRESIPKSLARYDHFGDLDQAGGLLYVPLGGGGSPRLAVFRAADLSFIGSQVLQPYANRVQRQAGWCAIHPVTGLLYTSNNLLDREENPIFISSVELKGARLKLRLNRTMYARDSKGEKMEIKPYMQGGVFSPDEAVPASGKRQGD